MWTVLVFVGLLSHVSGMDLGRKKSDDPDSTFPEYDPDTSTQSIHEIILQHTQDLLSHLATSCQPEQKSFGGQDGKVFCSENVRIKYANCRVICERNPSYGERLLCRATMFTRYLSSCFGGNLECVGEPEVTTSSPVMTTMRPVTTTIAPQTGNCGISNTGITRIIGGAAVAPNNFPTWQVGLTQVGVIPNNYRCSGSVITKRHILTAASCFTSQEIYNIGFGPNEATPTFIRRQNRVITHPKFNRNTFDYNIAIIELDQSIDFDRRAISPICLPGNDNDDLRVTAILRGWGDTVATGPGTCLTNGQSCLACSITAVTAGNADDCPCPVGQECTSGGTTAGSLCPTGESCQTGACSPATPCPCGVGFTCTVATNVATLNEARISINECPEESKYTNNMLCSAINTPARDACVGDAGGPLIIDSNGRFEQIGIISFGGQVCGQAGGTGVYVNVAKFVDWINEIVAPERTFR